MDEHKRYPNCSYCSKINRKATAVSECINCHRYLCKGCSDKHKQNLHFASHKIVILQDGKREFCSKHNEAAVYICRACYPVRLICDVCMTLDDPCHAPANFVDYATALSDIETQIKLELRRSKSEEESLSRVESREQMLIKQVQENAAAFIKRIEVTSNDITSRIKKSLDKKSLELAVNTVKRSRLIVQELLEKDDKSISELNEAAKQFIRTLKKQSEEKERTLNFDPNQIPDQKERVLHVVEQEETLAGTGGTFMKLKLFGFTTNMDHVNYGKTSTEKRVPVPVDPKTLGTDFDIGSLVEIIQQKMPRFGVIRWIGYYDDPKQPLVGVEMEQENTAYTDGTYLKFKLFHCPPKRATFTYLSNCRTDRRFLHSTRNQPYKTKTSPGIPGDLIQPIECIELVQGKNKGIQSHGNSSYLDATLFSMFAFNGDFDNIIKIKATEALLIHNQAHTILRESVVNRLRKSKFVPDGNMLQLRTALEKLGKVTGHTTDIKEPEDFLNNLLGNVLKSEPFIKLRTGTDSYVHQLLVDDSSKHSTPTTQQLLNLSFGQNAEKFLQVPHCLILRLPRSGKKLKMFRRIYCSLELDITQLLGNKPLLCELCGVKQAVNECSQCYRNIAENKDLCVIPFCHECSILFHGHPQRRDHKLMTLPTVKRQSVSSPVYDAQETLELFAVLCIETNHYVAFVKCGTGGTAEWVYFDGMAEREDQRNIPEVIRCPQVAELLSGEGRQEANSKEDSDLPPLLRRLVVDPYMCFYRHPDALLYT